MTRLALLVVLPFTALAQSSIQGLVLDPSGAAVPDAAITATFDATGAIRAARTGPDGRYRLPALSIGTYTIRCEKAGFQRAEIPQVYLALNQTLEQTIQLKLATAGRPSMCGSSPKLSTPPRRPPAWEFAARLWKRLRPRTAAISGVVLLAPGVAPAAGSNALRTKAGVRAAIAR